MDSSGGEDIRVKELQSLTEARLFTYFERGMSKWIGVKAPISAGNLPWIAIILNPISKEGVQQRQEQFPRHPYGSEDSSVSRWQDLCYASLATGWQPVTVIFLHEHKFKVPRSVSTKWNPAGVSGKESAFFLPPRFRGRHVHL